MVSKKRPGRSHGDEARPFFFSSLGRPLRYVWELLLRLLFRQGRKDSAVLGNDPRGDLGRRGEQAASDFLIKRGCTILARNVRYPEGELDIVVRDGQSLVFVEVRTRRSLRHGEIWESITPAKRRRVVRAAQRFRSEHRLLSVPCRFDVITVLWPDSLAEPTITHFPGAFEAD